MVIVLLGPPGAGKGTQAKRIAKRYKLKLLSIGDFLRAESEKNTKIGNLVLPYLREGSLVPDDIIIDIIEGLIGENPEGFILDGFPRNLNQAKNLMEILYKHEELSIIVIEIDCCEKEVVQRLASRRLCPRCKRVYNLETNPPKQDEICNDCGVQLYQRKDDRPEVIKKRLAVYHKETKPITDYFKKLGIYHHVSTDGNIMEVFEIIRKIIDGDNI